MGIFDYQSGNSQGILIHVLGINPAIDTVILSSMIVCFRK